MKKTVIVIVLLALADYIYSLTSGRPRSVNRSPFDRQLLEEKFSRFEGFDTDPVIPFFQDGGQESVGFLAEKLESADAAVRAKAAVALRQMGPRFTASEAGVAALCGVLQKPDAEDGIFAGGGSIAAGALGDIGPKAGAAVPALIQCVSVCTNINGVWALGRIGPAAAAALPVLESKMKQPAGRERVYAAGAVWNIGGDKVAAKAVVANALNDPDSHVRVDAKNMVTEYPEIGLP